MVDSRTYILDRIKSRKVSIEEFNYDKLTAPPIALMFTPQDIQDLYYIAHSIKLASRPKEKLEYIDQIMTRRGFVKFVGGTNRISYRPIEDNSFIVKVAIDDVGRSDNPREFKNQHALKPFVTKVFEVTPCGTLGVFERVVPITNRQEFMSISEDVFTLINEWLIGEYVLDDIGSNYFMNYGIRKGFGVVLLDYPYMYKVDYNKLFCALEDKTHTTKSGRCEGEIDYDDGYNRLVCTKCGAIYKAIDLAKAIEEDKVIIKGGGIHMSLKISISGGSKNAKEVVEVNNNAVVSTPSKPIAPSLFSKGPSNNSGLNIRITRNGEDVNKKEETVMAVNGVGEAGDLTIHEAKQDEKVVEEVVATTEEPEAVEESADVNSEIPAEEVEITTPIVFHEDDSERLKEIKKEAEEKINESLKDPSEDIFDYLESCDPKEVTAAITKYIEEHCHLESTFNGMSVDEDENNNKVLVINYHVGIKTDDDKYSIDIMAEDDFIPLGVTFDTLKTFLDNSGITLKDIGTDSYTGFYRVAGKTINKKEIDSNSDSYKVIALIDENGDYIVNSNNEIIVVEMIDNRNTANLCIKSIQWVKCVEDRLKKLDNVDSDDNGDTEVKKAPVGAAPEYSEENIKEE